jgi:hypothetical protein
MSRNRCNIGRKQPETARKLWYPTGGIGPLGRTDMGTFLFLALSSAFLLGMVAGAFTRRIVD